MITKNEKLIWSLMEGLDNVIENTHTNEEKTMYHSLRTQIESIYGIKTSTIKYGISGEVIKHVPIIREIPLSMVFDYFKDS